MFGRINSMTGIFTDILTEKIKDNGQSLNKGHYNYGVLYTISVHAHCALLEPMLYSTYFTYMHA